MTTVAVLTDSTASIPEDAWEHLHIHTVAYYIRRVHAYQQMAGMVAETVGRSKAKVAYMHADAQHEVEKIKELVEAKVDVVESLIGERSPALAVHTGPGTAGLCYYPVET